VTSGSYTEQISPVISSRGSFQLALGILMRPLRKSRMADLSDQLHDVIPLSRYSFYLSGRESCVRSHGEEVLDNLDRAFGQRIDVERLTRAEMLFWFWLLGAYEVVRTMTHTSDCFADHYVGHLKNLKKRLEFARIPAAKMEPRRKTTPINSNRSPADINLKERDLRVGDPGGPIDSCRELIRAYLEVMGQADSSTILKSHEDSVVWRKDA
jgi:hypothetical protein